MAVRRSRWPAVAGAAALINALLATILYTVESVPGWFIASLVIGDVAIALVAIYLHSGVSFWNPRLANLSLVAVLIGLPVQTFFRFMLVTGGPSGAYGPFFAILLLALPLVHMFRAFGFIVLVALAIRSQAWSKLERVAVSSIGLLAAAVGLFGLLERIEPVLMRDLAIGAGAMQILFWFLLSFGFVVEAQRRTKPRPEPVRHG